METEDVYGDLPNDCDLGGEVEKLQKQNKFLQELIHSLESDIEKLCAKITEMKKVQDNLSKNISELFKTAKTEIERKDKTIAELRRQLDDLCFKRKHVNTSTKRDRDNSPALDYVSHESNPKKMRHENDENRINSFKYTSCYSREKSRSRSSERHRRNYRDRSNERKRREFSDERYSSSRHKREYSRKHDSIRDDREKRSTESSSFKSHNDGKETDKIKHETSKSLSKSKITREEIKVPNNVISHIKSTNINNCAEEEKILTEVMVEKEVLSEEPPTKIQILQNQGIRENLKEKTSEEKQNISTSDSKEDMKSLNVEVSEPPKEKYALPNDEGISKKRTERVFSGKKLDKSKIEALSLSILPKENKNEVKKNKTRIEEVSKKLFERLGEQAKHDQEMSNFINLQMLSDEFDLDVSEISKKMICEEKKDDASKINQKEISSAANKDNFKSDLKIAEKQTKIDDEVTVISSDKQKTQDQSNDHVGDKKIEEKSDADSTENKKVDDRRISKEITTSKHDHNAQKKIKLNDKKSREIIKSNSQKTEDRSATKTKSDNNQNIVENPSKKRSSDNQTTERKIDTSLEQKVTKSDDKIDKSDNSQKTEEKRTNSISEKAKSNDNHKTEEKVGTDTSSCKRNVEVDTGKKDEKCSRSSESEKAKTSDKDNKENLKSGDNRKIEEKTVTDGSERKSKCNSGIDSQKPEEKKRTDVPTKKSKSDTNLALKKTQSDNNNDKGESKSDKSQNNTNTRVSEEKDTSNTEKIEAEISTGVAPKKSRSDTSLAPKKSRSDDNSDKESFKCDGQKTEESILETRLKSNLSEGSQKVGEKSGTNLASKNTKPDDKENAKSDDYRKTEEKSRNLIQETNKSEDKSTKERTKPVDSQNALEKMNIDVLEEKVKSDEVGKKNERRTSVGMTEMTPKGDNKIKDVDTVSSSKKSVERIRPNLLQKRIKPNFLMDEMNRGITGLANEEKKVVSKPNLIQETNKSEDKSRKERTKSVDSQNALEKMNIDVLEGKVKSDEVGRKNERRTSVGMTEMTPKGDNKIKDVDTISSSQKSVERIRPNLPQKSIKPNFLMDEMNRDMTELANEEKKVVSKPKKIVKITNNQSTNNDGEQEKKVPEKKSRRSSSKASENKHNKNEGKDDKLLTQKVVVTLNREEVEVSKEDKSKETGTPKSVKKTKGSKDVEKSDVINKKDKSDDGIPESDRVLRSATRRNIYKDKMKKTADQQNESKRNSDENTKNEENAKSPLRPKNIFNANVGNDSIGVNLTHDGEIPVLHLSDNDNSFCGKNLFDYTVLNIDKCVHMSTPVNIDLLKEDLNISSISVENESKTTNSVDNSTNCQKTENSLQLSLTNVNNSNSLSSSTNQQRIVNTSSLRKRRRVILTMVD